MSRYMYGVGGRNKVGNALPYFGDQSEAQAPCSCIKWVNIKSFLPMKAFLNFCLICLHLFD